MASVRVIREEPKPAIPPIKEVVLTFSEEEAVYLRRLVGHHVYGGGAHDGEEAHRLRQINSSVHDALAVSLGRDNEGPLPIDRSERSNALYLRSEP